MVTVRDRKAYWSAVLQSQKYEAHDRLYYYKDNQNRLRRERYLENLCKPLLGGRSPYEDVIERELSHFKLKNIWSWLFDFISAVF